MAKQVIILNAVDNNGNGTIVNVVFWLAIASGKEIVLPGAVSAWSGASAAENTAIANGTVIEELFTTGWGATTTKAQAEADLATRFSVRQALVTARPNLKQFTSAFLDSVTGWSV